MCAYMCVVNGSTLDSSQKHAYCLDNSAFRVYIIFSLVNPAHCKHFLGNLLMGTEYVAGPGYHSCLLVGGISCCKTPPWFIFLEQSNATLGVWFFFFPTSFFFRLLSSILKCLWQYNQTFQLFQRAHQFSSLVIWCHHLNHWEISRFVLHKSQHI